MTTIAWDGKTLAVDSRVTLGQDIYDDNCHKLVRNVGPFAALAIAGDLDKALDYIDTILKPLKKPKDLWGEDSPDDFSIIGVLKDTGECWFLNGDVTYTLPIPWAYGSGGDYAISAMDHGDTAEQAVRYASTRDTKTNNKVRKYTVPVKTKEAK